VCLSEPIYNGVLTALQVACTVALYFFFEDDEKQKKKNLFDVDALESPVVILSIIFLVDLGLNIVVFSLKHIWAERKLLVFEAVTQLCFWIFFSIDILHRAHSKESFVGHSMQLDILFLLRNVRVFELFTELNDFNVLMTTIKNMTKSIFSKLLFLYVIYFTYAIVGGSIFGGKINHEAV